MESRRKTIVGVNDFVQDDSSVETLYIDESTSEKQLDKLARLRKSRNNDRRPDGARRAARGAARRNRT